MRLEAIVKNQYVRISGNKYTDLQIISSMHTLLLLCSLRRVIISRAVCLSFMFLMMFDVHVFSVINHINN